jgi:hypothetical protein
MLQRDGVVMVEMKVLLMMMMMVVIASAKLTWRADVLVRGE